MFVRAAGHGGSFQDSGPRLSDERERITGRKESENPGCECLWNGYGMVPACLPKDKYRCPSKTHRLENSR